ncbi:MAG: NAD(P)-binding protein [Candidatus Omnitrophica bacterium]|nr:NAD(P)-binding protein [Candidatus Omnitrophota bacterium]MBU1924543.1 NAD(P)-binding protein [Candidatus Omnitrophota bacterium]
MKIAILGAGISGLSCGLKLNEFGFEDITIFEQDSQIGGLAKSRIKNGYVFDLHGGHVFNSNFPDVKTWVFNMLKQKDWKFQTRNTKILYGNRLINYPFEYALLELSEDEAIECVVDFITAKNKPKPDNYYNWLIYAFGDAIAHKYMIPYNEKIWAYNLKKMSIDWIDGKMPISNVKQIIASLLKRNSSKAEIPHATFYYPNKGGIQSLINIMAKNIKAEIVTECTVVDIDKIKRKFIINGQDKFDLIISTICLRDLIEAVRGLSVSVRKKAADLKYNSLTTAFCKCAKNDISWFYIPDKKIRAHRVSYQGNLSSFNCPSGNGSSATLEMIGMTDPEQDAKEFNRYRKIDNLKVRNIIDSAFVKYAYIIFDKGYKHNLDSINKCLDNYGILRTGRFAEWKYYNMDVCMKRAFDTAGDITRKYK